MIPSLLLALAPLAQGATVDATVVAWSGDPVGSDALDIIGPPFVTAAGTPATFGRTDAGEDVLLLGGSPLFRASDALPVVVANGELVVGALDDGRFVFGPTLDGVDGLWTHTGVFAVAGEHAVGFPPGATWTQLSRPRITSDGSVWWVVSVSLTGGTGTDARALMRAADGNPAFAEVVLATGDDVGGVALDTLGVDLMYGVSSDGAHHITRLDRATGNSDTDGAIALDGILLAAEEQLLPGSATEYFDNFDAVAVNRPGDWCLTGDTNALATMDEIVWCDDGLLLKEAMVVDGETLGGAVRFVSLDDGGHVASGWLTASGEAAFVTCDPADPVATTRRVLATGDLLDLDGDGSGDVTVTDLGQVNAFPSAGFANDGTLYVDLEVDDGGVQREALVGVDASCCAGDADGDAICDVDDQCWGDDWTGDTDADGICDSHELTLELLDPVAPGAPFRVRLEHAKPGAVVRVHATMRPAGVGPCLPSGACGDLGSVSQDVARGRADAEGVAELTIDGPPNLPVGRAFRLQAFWWGGASGDVSNAVETVTVP